MSSSIRELVRLLHSWLLQRSVAGALLRWGVFLLLGAAGGFALSFSHRGETGTWSFSLETGGSGDRLVVLAAVIGVLLITLGVGISWRDWRLGRKALARRRHLAIEVRGLSSAGNTPLKGAHDLLPAGVEVREVFIDLRAFVADGVVTQPERALEKLSQLPLALTTHYDGVDRHDVTATVGGLASVPFLFLLGTLLDDEQEFEIVDWERDSKVWRRLDAVDDGVRLVPNSADAAALSRSREVVVCVSASYPVDSAALAASFPPDWPRLLLTSSSPGANRLWSKPGQQAIAAQVRDLLVSLSGSHVARVHLVFAAGASLCIRTGAVYDPRLMPELLVYQYEKSNTPAYPWAVRLPSHGSGPAILRNEYNASP